MSKFLIIHPEELSVKWIYRLRALNVDTLGIHSCGGTNAHMYLQNMIENLKNENVQELLNMAKEQGLNVEYELHSASSGEVFQ